PAYCFARSGPSDLQASAASNCRAPLISCLTLSFRCLAQFSAQPTDLTSPATRHRLPPPECLPVPRSARRHTFAPLGATAAPHRYGGPPQWLVGDHPGAFFLGAQRLRAGTHATPRSASHARFAPFPATRGQRLMLSIDK